ncbi:MAG: DNA repair protein RadC [Holosporaceae bacterium]|jgi:DNA repair protein RadC|nr:DNA repair protein RadC [Holosporaceae bacterium]
MISRPLDQKYNLGHRKRLKKRFAADPASFPDYELLELLMFYVFARKDTKSLAKTLLSHFKTLGRVMSANATELKKIPGLGESAANLLTAVHEIFNRIHLESLKEQDIAISSSDQVLEYYKGLLENEKKEQLRLMLLNNKNKLIADKLMQSGTINQTAIYPREIIELALEYGASAMIMVHNHPSGDPQPSRQDIITTKSIADIAQKLDILLLDHIIIGKNSSRSLKEMGLI